MTYKPWLRPLALLFAFALVASACGGGDDEAEDGEAVATEESDDGGTINQDEAADAVAEAANDSDDTGEAEAPASTASSIEELEEEWAAQRQAIVDELLPKIESGEYGLGDDDILRGPAGFQVDMATCPDDWSDTEGISDDTIKIGHPGVQSGNLASYGNMGVGWEVYLDYVNEAHGGVAGKNLELLRRGTTSTWRQRPSRWSTSCFQTEKPLFFHTLGSPNTLAVYDTLNEACVPHCCSWLPVIRRGATPLNHPWVDQQPDVVRHRGNPLGRLDQGEHGRPATGEGGRVWYMDNDFGLSPMRTGLREMGRGQP